MSQSGFGAQQARSILNSTLELIAYGEVEWHTNQGSCNGDTQIADVQIEGMPSLLYRVVLRPRRLYQPTFVMFLGGRHLQRIDVNGAHDFREYTHQQIATPDDPEVDDPAVDLSDSFPVVPKTSTISEELLFRCYRAAAHRFRIDITGVQWTTPPLEGVTR